jgi:tetratricopeptide (TPR) repeat protein
VFPVHLSVMATPEDSRLWPGIVAACALAAIAFVPGVRRRHVAFALACFVAFVLPGAPASRMLALESRLALPAIAIVLIACEVAERPAWPARARLAAGAVVLAALAAVTFSYAGSFRDRLSFAQAAVSGAPHLALAHRNLGVAYHLEGQTALARQEYEAAVAQDAGEPIVHNNLAVMLMAEGRLLEAEQELRAELAVNPNYAVAHDNLARVLGALGRVQEAEREQATAAKVGALETLVDKHAVNTARTVSDMRGQLSATEKVGQCLRRELEGGAEKWNNATTDFEGATKRLTQLCADLQARPWRSHWVLMILLLIVTFVAGYALGLDQPTSR